MHHQNKLIFTKYITTVLYHEKPTIHQVRFAIKRQKSMLFFVHMYDNQNSFLVSGVKHQ